MPNGVLLADTIRGQTHTVFNASSEHIGSSPELLARRRHVEAIASRWSRSTGGRA
jgi:hypothetical protein